MLNLSIKAKLTAFLIGAFILFAALLIGFSAVRSFTGLENARIHQLQTVKEAKRDHILSYFDQLKSNVLALAESVFVAEAMSQFESAFGSAEWEYTAENSKAIRDALMIHYSKEYLNRIDFTLPGAKDRKDTDKYIPLSESGRILQKLYIVDNPNAIGKKDLLDRAGSDLTYGSLHSRFHPTFRSFVKNLNLYDIFLVNWEGNVVYSAFKEKDFGTNLIEGPYKDSGLARAFGKAMKGKAGEVYFEDFSAYEPSYNTSSGFLSSPISVGGAVLGALIVQMPVDAIDNIMNFGGEYQHAGLMNTGEIYLVGQDRFMRSKSRFTDQLDNELVQKYHTTVGLLQVNTPAADKALGGENANVIDKNYRGREAVTSYAPLDVFGVRWAIVADIETKEALGSVRSLTTLMVIISAVITLIMVGFTTVIVNRMVIRKLTGLTSQVQSLIVDESGKKRIDLTKLHEIAEESKAACNMKDEINLLYCTFAFLMETTNEVVQEVALSSESLSSGTSQLAATSEQLSITFHDQARQVSSVAAAMEEMTASAAGIMETLQELTGKSGSARISTDEGKAKLHEVGSSIEMIRQATQEMAETVSRVAGSSEKISEILVVINDIADQTNLLALNAAIEAARAGDAGRGFAVVADEVRKLAERTQRATQEISGIITDFRQETSVVSKNMDSAGKLVSQGVNIIGHTEEIFNVIVNAVNEVDTASKLINHTITEQNRTISSVNDNAQAISSGIEQSSIAAGEMTTTIASLQERAVALKSNAETFKL